MCRASSSGFSDGSERGARERRVLHLRPLGARWPDRARVHGARWTPVWELGEGGIHLDLTGTERLHGGGDDGPIRVCREAAARWGALAGGSAPSRLAAALASRIAADDAVRRLVSGERPALLLCVAPGSVEAFLAPFPVSVLGRGQLETVNVLRRAGLRTLGDLQELPAARLAAWLGAEGARLAELARGMDRTPRSAACSRTATVVAVAFERPLSGRLPLATLWRATAGRALLACPEGPGAWAWWDLRARRGGGWETARVTAEPAAGGTLGDWLALLQRLWRRLPPRRAGLTALCLAAGERRRDARAAQGELFGPTAAERLAAAWRRAGHRDPGLVHLAAQELLEDWGAVWSDPQRET